jgi:cytidyltransferase-like protein
VERKLGAAVRILYPGGFDCFHAAHLAALQAARRIAGPAGTLLVAVNSDAFMAHYKRKPMHTDRKRVLDVQDSGLADEVSIWEGPDGQAEQILAANPDIYIAGTDWLSKDLAQQLHIPSLAWFDEHAISLLYLRRTPGISTTQLIAAQGSA